MIGRATSLASYESSYSTANKSDEKAGIEISENLEEDDKHPIDSTAPFFIPYPQRSIIGRAGTASLASDSTNSGTKNI